MRIFEVKDRGEDILRSLLDVWESSVRATHLFLSEQEIARIKKYVPQALCAGIDGYKLEMLFVSAEYRGQGIGRRLLQYAVDKYAVRELAVNEQNPQAVGFYEHMGFRTFRRSQTDEQGGLYPILYMRGYDDKM